MEKEIRAKIEVEAEHDGEASLIMTGSAMDIRACLLLIIEKMAQLEHVEMGEIVMELLVVSMEAENERGIKQGLIKAMEDYNG